ncbi:MAG: 1-deoxy-D-xylulose-5-phosphate reductoisomerase [Lentisphaerae bacterium]|nr:1-deoxy-D-xylulose-5-phosphate reductoisomerase [Lentisphaerota bacterium]
MKNIVVLGSTGSIGENTLRVAEELQSRFRVVGLAVGREYKRMLEQAAQFDVRHVAVADERAAVLCRAAAPENVIVHVGDEGVAEIAALESADIVLCAIVGMAGLRPVLAAVEAGHDVALATKEVLVAAGGIVTEACKLYGCKLLPVDSEHSAILQCLTGAGNGQWDERCVKRLVLTASGGPFQNKPDVDFDKVSIKEALNHPNWNMGKKVTIDSATLMNKGLEIMEAGWLFDMTADRIDVVIHPESIVHSMVEFTDSSVIAQMSVPDMRFAIQYALTCPERVEGRLPGLNLADVGSLTFARPDAARFPCLGLARKALDIGGTMPAVLNAANEVAVGRFLGGLIPFSGIWRTVEKIMSKHDIVRKPCLDDILEADRWARKEAE